MMAASPTGSNRSGGSDAAWRSLRLAIQFSVLAHLVAGLAMLFGLRHGLVTNPDWESRLPFLANSTTLWTAAWLTWHIAPVSLLLFLYALNQAQERTSGRANGPGRVALLLCAAAIACDLAAQAILIGVLPELARAALNSPPEPGAALLLQTMDRAAILLTGYVGNGLYTLAALLLIFSTRRLFPAWVVVAGGGVVAGGVALSAAALANSVAGLFWSNALLVPAILLWQSGIWLESRRR